MCSINTLDHSTGQTVALQYFMVMEHFCIKMSEKKSLFFQLFILPQQCSNPEKSVHLHEVSFGHLSLQHQSVRKEVGCNFIQNRKVCFVHEYFCLIQVRYICMTWLFDSGTTRAITVFFCHFSSCRSNCMFKQKKSIQICCNGPSLCQIML